MIDNDEFNFVCGDMSAGGDLLLEIQDSVNHKDEFNFKCNGDMFCRLVKWFAH